MQETKDRLARSLIGYLSRNEFELVVESPTAVTYTY